MLEQVRDLIEPVVGRDRRDRAAERIEREMMEDELGTLIEQDCDAMARAEYRGLVPRHALLNFVPGLFPGKADAPGW